MEARVVWLRVLAACVSAFLTTTAPARGQDQSQQEAAIRARAAAYQDAIRQGDARSLAEFWTEDGTYIDAAGRSFPARELIRQELGQEAAAPPQSTPEVESSIRFVTPDVAIEDGTVRQPTAGAGSTAAYTAIWLKQDQWRLHRLREWTRDADRPQRPLQALAWMIGDWVGRNPEYTARWSASWSENEQFIVRRFAVEQDGRVILSGTQRIGWDPRTRRVRSWSFDSDGGIVEGSWRAEGDSWIVKSVGALPDGTEFSLINFWVPEGQDQCVLHSSHGEAGPAKMEDATVEFRRRTER